MVEKIVQHKHCPVCGRAMPPDATTCSEECEERFKMMVRRRKLWLYAFYGAIFLFVLMLVLSAK